MSSSALEDLGPEHALLVHLRVDGARTPARVRLTVGPDLRLALLSSDGRLVHLVRTCLVDVEAYRRTASAAPLLIQRLPEGRSWPGETEPGGAGRPSPAQSPWPTPAATVRTRATGARIRAAAASILVVRASIRAVAIPTPAAG